jgi:uncharacterized membrane protein YphA (DoxX/SURF4 family)
MGRTISTGSQRTTTARRAGTIVLWALQVALAVAFAGAGLAKLAGDTQMVLMFSQIGAGQWLRYLVGALELAGAIGLLLPRLAGLAALGLAALMIGATVTNLLVLNASPAPSLGLLLAAGLIAWIRRDQLNVRAVAHTG